ncbi:MAG: hypothetical protein C0473_00450 [Cyanobacteria bacterium DS3.002]|nr:hypothetical protein [Cyanobacteria bacterium DS3.002]
MSAIPRELRIRVELLEADYLEVGRVLSWQLGADSSTRLVSVEGTCLLTKTYFEWEAVLGGLTAYLVNELNLGASQKEELWRAKNAIGNTLIGLQEERIRLGIR